MSDNTYLKITQKSTRTDFHITHRNADTGQMLADLGYEHTLEDAVRKANEWDYGVEYGLSIDLRERK